MKIEPNGPAAQAGVRKDDVILSINNKPTNSIKDLRNILDEVQVGEKIQLLIMRNEREQTLHMNVGEVPAEYLP